MAWLLLCGFRCEADGGQLRETVHVQKETLVSYKTGVAVLFAPAMTLDAGEDILWKAAAGKVAPQTPLIFSGSPPSLLLSPTDGCFLPDCDGLEAVWDTQEALSYTPTQVSAALAVSPEPPKSGKMMMGFDRYIAFLTEKDDKTRCLRIGATYILTLAGTEAVSARLLSREEEAGEELLCFCYAASPRLYDCPRVTEAALSLSCKTVMRLPRTALLFDEAEQPYVLCARGGHAVARGVCILAYDGEEVLLSPTDGKMTVLGQTLPCLMAGDEVLVCPQGLTHLSALYRKNDPYAYLKYIFATEKEKRND